MKPERDLASASSGGPAHDKHKKHGLLRVIRDHSKSVDLPAGTIASDTGASPTHVKTVSYDAEHLHEHEGVAPGDSVPELLGVAVGVAQ